jgi:hypothetical protein
MNHDHPDKVKRRMASSRREFLAAGTGALLGGVTGMVVAGGVSPERPVHRADPSLPSDIQEGEFPSIPWKYAELDVDLVRRRGYEAYSKYSCCYAAAYALLTTLKETSGGSWTTIPPEMFRFGAGGGLGWGTMCGALTSCLAVLNLASLRFDELGNELIGWYTTMPFPSLHHEEYARHKNQLTTVANSPLCHISVGIWAKAAGARIKGEEKIDRCAKLTGDTAAMTATLLNEALHETFVLQYKPQREFSHCLDCHQGGKSLRDDQQGKFNCLMCHDEHPRQH